MKVIVDNKIPFIKEAIEKKQGKKCTDILKSIQEIADTSDGLLIFIDEMGKCLESAAKGQGDVYLFQQLAEYVSRSNGKIILIGILHQAFAEYARYLPHTIRDEWIKIQGRFVDTPINTAGEEQIELISKAITTDFTSSSIKDVVEKTVIRMRFGIDSEEYSLESIAQIKSVTRQRIQQVEVKALDKLRQLARSVLKVERP